MKYKYFISYFSSSKENNIQAFSSCHVTRDEKITNYDELLEIGNLLEEEFNRKNVVILNYILLSEDLIVEEDNE